MARVPFLSACAALTLAASIAAAAEPASMASASSATDIFDAEAANLVTLRYIPNNSRSAQVIIVNRTNRPLTLRMPSSFVGVPVLAQMGMGGMGMGGGGAAGGGGGGGAQATGGGMGGGMRGGMGGGGMGGMGGMGGGGGAFSIPPERSRTFRVPTVCLEHGKPEPSPNMAYKMVRTDTFSDDPTLAVVLESLGNGELPQKVAQAATWNIANGLSWQRLSAEMIDHAGGVPDEPFFAPAELLAAHRVVAMAGEIASRRAGSSAGTSSPGERSR
jgi:hypothetical protein